MRGYPIPPAALEYIRQNLDEWPSVLAYKLKMFGCTCGKRQVAEHIRQFKKTQLRQ